MGVVKNGDGLLYHGTLKSGASQERYELSCFFAKQIYQLKNIQIGIVLANELCNGSYSEYMINCHFSFLSVVKFGI